MNRKRQLSIGWSYIVTFRSAKDRENATFAERKVTLVFRPMLRRKRFGFSLIELLLAVTFGSLVMVIGVSMINRSMKGHATMQEQVQQASSFNRFAEQFRRDVHEAARLDFSDSALSLTNNRGETFQYESSGRSVVCERIVTSVRRLEQIELRQGQSASFACQPDAKLCIFEVRSSMQDGSKRVSRRIEVAMGLNCLTGANQ